MSLFGPQNANAATVLPDGTQRQRYGTQQTWVKDASAPGMSDGTVLDAAFFNRIIANLEYVVSQGGAAGMPPGSVNVLYEGILGIVGEGAPGNLQTIAQIAASINNDPEVWTTLINQINACVHFDKPQTLSAPQVLQVQQNLQLGNVAFMTAGTGANQLVQLTSTGKLPAVDGSLLSGVNASNVATPPAGQCRLSLNAGNLVLNRYRGKYLTIGGVLCTIPAAGLSLPATGMNPGLLYYIYATQSGGVVNAIVASPTGHSTDTTAGNEGVEIMTGDNTKSLVGMARAVGAGPLWTDSAAQRFVRSWFNREKRSLSNVYTTTRTNSGTSAFTETNAEIRVEFLSWADELIDLNVNGYAFSSAANDYVVTAIAVDSTSLPAGKPTQVYSTNGGAVGVAAKVTGLAEGYHFATVLGRVRLTGTANWVVDATTGAATELQGAIL